MLQTRKKLLIFMHYSLQIKQMMYSIGIFRAPVVTEFISSIGATLESMTSRRQIQDGGPHDFRSKMAAPMTPRGRAPRNQDGGPCDAFGYTSEGESTP